MSAMTINPEQGLFVFSHGTHVTCLGFEVVFKRLRQYCQLLGWQFPSHTQKGSEEQWACYRKAESALIKLGRNATLFSPDTPQEVQSVLNQAISTRARIRVVFGDPETGRDSLEEYDVIGYVSRTTGALKSPILVHNRASFGGVLMSTDRILRIVDVKTRRDLYRCPTYKVPEVQYKTGDAEGLEFEAWVNDSCIARFKSSDARERWAQFIRCERFAK